MFDLSWGEMLLIGAVALIVIGPKDLPRTLRAVGQGIGKVRRMASQFQSQFNQAMREAELDEVRKEVESMNRIASAGLNPVKAVRDEIRNAVVGAPVTPAPTTTTPSAPPPPAVAAPSPAPEAAPEPVAAAAAAPAPAQTSETKP